MAQPNVTTGDLRDSDDVVSPPILGHRLKPADGLRDILRGLGEVTPTLSIGEMKQLRTRSAAKKKRRPGDEASGFELERLPIAVESPVLCRSTLVRSTLC